MRFERVLVVGAGQMGGGIAQVLAASGRTVLLHDAAPGAVERALAGMAKCLEKLAAKGAPHDPADQRRYSIPRDPDRRRCAFCGRAVRDAVPVRRASWRRPRVRRGPRLPMGRAARRPRGRGS